MSRFTVGQEITPKKTCVGLTRGKFYRVSAHWNGADIVVDDDGDSHSITDDFGLTREEYQQAEREKDPFAPGKWVVCVRNDYPARVGDFLQITSASDKSISFKANFEDDFITECTFVKHKFRPATPEEIKEQERKAMNETKDDPSVTDRQAFTVDGQEFYVGQSAWAAGDGPHAKDGEVLEVLGFMSGPNSNIGVSVRNKETLGCFGVRVSGLTTTPPKPHEWKFGDWARHPDMGVVFVASSVDATDEVLVCGYSSDGDRYGYVNSETLTYISTTEIPE